MLKSFPPKIFFLTLLACLFFVYYLRNEI
jgi:hypothetical protein